MPAPRNPGIRHYVVQHDRQAKKVIGENSARLSGGERQRLSPIILLDEATASIDTENETKIQKALSTLVKGKTVIIIAHRMRTIMGVDHVVVLKGGALAEQGTPQELMRQDGLFAKMNRFQKESSAWTV